MYTVTRQHYWHNGEYTVELSIGGFDCAGPDMLAQKYPGEGETYLNPIEVVNAAVEICQHWQKDTPDEKIYITHGCNLDICCADLNKPTKKFITALKKWAKKEYDSLPKCDQCGDLLPNETWSTEFEPDLKFCREYCIDKYMQDNWYEENEVE